MSTDLETVNAAMQRLVLDSNLPCANNCDAATSCKKAGAFGCAGCRLTAYCSKECQVAHWPIHRKDCNSPLQKSTWEPSYFAQRRTPGFLMDLPLFVGGRIYLWGDVPAIDVIRFGKNEGEDFRGSLDILFAAPGNMRNAIFSVVNLPKSYQGPLNIVINDNELAMVARNVIFLLIFFLEDDPIMAAEYVLHTWYSALVTKPCYDMLQNKIKPVVKSVCDKIAHKTGQTLLGETWSFGKSSLRLALTRNDWFSLLSYFDVPQGLDKDSAQLVRGKVTSNPDGVDQYERDLCYKSPPARVATAKFRGDGILLPFGQSREEFIIPNPTIFHTGKPWPLIEDADPTSEWPMKPIANFDIGPARNDVYGKLYHYLRQLFVDFLRQLRSLPVKFEFLRLDARILRDQLSGKHFDRIDASNLVDIGYIGVKETLKALGPLLKPTTANKHATLIVLFVNAINEMIMMQDSHPVTRRLRERDTEVQVHRATYYMPELKEDHLTNVSKLKLVGAQDLLYDMDGYFNRYMNLRRFTDIGSNAGLQMKDNHTIIDPWPLKLPGGRATKEIQEYFALLLASGHTGQERYVEWKRGIASVTDETD
ncbi:hypothetical protein F4776DRAFT_643594 [Hypoxylon sp. NC0597]|nr:hypothetical protein F4776DRAFT_643594 [Hypoxylon sp. NC0597]